MLSIAGASLSEARHFESQHNRGRGKTPPASTRTLPLYYLGVYTDLREPKWDKRCANNTQLTHSLTHSQTFPAAGAVVKSMWGSLRLVSKVPANFPEHRIWTEH